MTSALLVLFWTLTDIVWSQYSSHPHPDNRHLPKLTLHSTRHWPLTPDIKAHNETITFVSAHYGLSPEWTGWDRFKRRDSLTHWGRQGRTEESDLIPSIVPRFESSVRPVLRFLAVDLYSFDICTSPLTLKNFTQPRQVFFLKSLAFFYELNSWTHQLCSGCWWATGLDPPVSRHHAWILEGGVFSF